MKLLQLSYGWQRGFMKCGMYMLGCFLCQWSLIILGFLSTASKMFFLNSLYGSSTLEGFYSIYFLFRVKAVIYVPLCPFLCFYSVLSPCLTNICPISGLPSEPGQCGGVSRVRGQPSGSTTQKKKQKELWSHCCWQILAKTQRKVNIYCW